MQTYKSFGPFLLINFKPRPLIITTTLNEFFNLDKGETEKGECVKAMVAFGLQEKSVFEACMERYHQDFKLNGWFFNIFSTFNILNCIIIKIYKWNISTKIYVCLKIQLMKEHLVPMGASYE